MSRRLAALALCLSLNPEVTDLVGRFDEGAPDVVVADNPEFERLAGLGGIADGRGHAGIGHRHHHIGVDHGFVGQLGADALARLVYALALDPAVGAREVDMFEDAEPLGHGRERLDAFDAAVRDHHHFAGLDVAHEPGAENVESTGLRRQHRRALHVANDQRPHAHGIAYADQRVVGHRHQGVGALDLVQGIDQAVDNRVQVAGGDEMDDDLGVAGRLEQAAALDKLVAHRDGIGQVSIMGDRQAAEGEFGEQRLDVAQNRLAGGRIAVVADRRMATQPVDDRGRAEVVADQAKAPVAVEMFAVIGNNARRFLSPVLQRMKAERRIGRRIHMAENAEDAAFRAEFVVAWARHGQCPSPAVIGSIR